MFGYMRNWHVATTRPLQQSRADRELRQQGFVTFNPRVRLRIPKPDGSMRYTVKPYIPGYIFVRFDRLHDLWGKIRGTHGVGRLLMCGDDPARIRKGVIEAMLRSFGDRFAIDERRLDELIIRTGDPIRILGDSFAALATTALESPHGRVNFMLEMFGRQVVSTAPRTSLRLAEAS